MNISFIQSTKSFWVFNFFEKSKSILFGNWQRLFAAKEMGKCSCIGCGVHTICMLGCKTVEMANFHVSKLLCGGLAKCTHFRAISCQCRYARAYSSLVRYSTTAINSIVMCNDVSLRAAYLINIERRLMTVNVNYGMPINAW